MSREQISAIQLSLVPPSFCIVIDLQEIFALIDFYFDYNQNTPHVQQNLSAFYF